MRKLDKKNIFIDILQTTNFIPDVAQLEFLSFEIISVL